MLTLLHAAAGRGCCISICLLHDILLKLEHVAHQAEVCVSPLPLLRFVPM
jgi:hypothetical protein